MEQYTDITSSTLQLLDGLGLEGTSTLFWSNPATQSHSFVPLPAIFEPLRFPHAVADSKRPLQPSCLLVNDTVFTQVFKRSPDAMTLSSIEEGRFIAVNDQFLELSEYTREDIIGATSIEVKLWPEPTDRLHLLEKLKQQGALYNEEGGFLTKSGQYKIVRVSAEIIPVDKIPYILCSIRDITQEKKAEEELKLVNERDRLLGKIALNIRQSLDLNQILQTTVTEVRSFLGVERVFVARFDDQKQGRISAESVLEPFPSLSKEVVSREIYDELSEIYQVRQIWVIDDMNAIETSSAFYFLVQRYQIRAGLGVPIWVNGSLFGVLVAHQCANPRPWTDFEQQLLMRLATQVTIAIQQSELFSEIQYLNTHLEQMVAERTQELEQRTQELEQRTQELEELGKFRDFLLHAVTHDLRNSVVGMTMFLQSLDGQAGGESVRLPWCLLQKMIRAGNMQQDKLDAIQEVYRIELQGLPLQPAAIALHSLVNHVIEPLQVRVDQSQGLIENALPPELPEIQGDTIQLERVFQHLITNAITHNPRGVRVHIQGTVEQHSLNPYVCVHVRDNGQGIDPEQCDRIFQLNADSPESPQYGGIRLGLYLCHQIIVAHGGKIGIDSRVGKGTTVWLKLPL